jgi:NAD+--asparagine ADP-ribosyltransferase
MYLRWSMFKDYCLHNNIQLLRDDIKFIERELQKIPPNEHRELLKEYTDVWLEILKENDNAPLGQNLARKTANKWLFQEVNRRQAPNAPIKI